MLDGNPYAIAAQRSVVLRASASVQCCANGAGLGKADMSLPSFRSRKGQLRGQKVEGVTPEQEVGLPPGGTPAPALGPWLRASPCVPALAVIAFAAAGEPTAPSFLSVLATCFVVAAGTLLVGAIIGFLFGLPRTVDRSDPSALITTNTNLDQISDWLTKILVALGLVQLGNFAHSLNRLATSIGRGLGGQPQDRTFILGLLVYSLTDGFLLGYLWTRIELSIRLKDAAEYLAVTSQVLSEPLEAPPPLPPAPPLDVKVTTDALDYVESPGDAAVAEAIAPNGDPADIAAPTSPEGATAIAPATAEE